MDVKGVDFLAFISKYSHHGNTEVPCFHPPRKFFRTSKMNGGFDMVAKKKAAKKAVKKVAKKSAKKSPAKKKAVKKTAKKK